MNVSVIARFQNSRVECIVLKGTDIRGARKSIEKSSLCGNEERAEVTYRMYLASNVASQSYHIMLLKALVVQELDTRESLPVCCSVRDARLEVFVCRQAHGRAKVRACYLFEAPR